MSMIISIRLFNIFLRNNFIYKLSKYGRRQTELLKILHGFADSVIVARREELSTKSKTDVNKNEIENDIGMKRKLALLDVLLQSSVEGKPLTNLDIREEVDTFIFGGHDTTTNAVSFCLYNLAKHPDTQQKTFDEIRHVLGDDVNKPINRNQLNNLRYLELVIKETLRLYPSVPYFGRKMLEDVEISENAFKVKESLENRIEHF